MIPIRIITRSGDGTNLQKCGANPGHWSPHLRHFLSGSSTGVIPLARTTALDMVRTCSNTALIKYIPINGKQPTVKLTCKIVL